MSTKSTIAYGEGFHFYHEVFEVFELDDQAPIHMELVGKVDFEVGRRGEGVRIRVAIPRAAVDDLLARDGRKRRL